MQLNPIDLGDVAAAVAAAVALIALGFTWWNAASARGARQAAEDSATHAARSAQAAEASAEAAQRSAEADETMARLAREEADRYVVPWRIEKDVNSRFRLIHDNESEPALDVRVEGESVHHNSWETLGPQESRQFYYTPDDWHSHDITIQWRRPSDPVGELRSYTTQPPTP